jgi:hypothetical protein
MQDPAEGELIDIAAFDLPQLKTYWDKAAKGGCHVCHLPFISPVNIYIISLKTSVLLSTRYW